MDEWMDRWMDGFIYGHKSKTKYLLNNNVIMFIYFPISIFRYIFVDVNNV